MRTAKNIKELSVSQSGPIFLSRIISNNNNDNNNKEEEEEEE